MSALSTSLFDLPFLCSSSPNMGKDKAGEKRGRDAEDSHRSHVKAARTANPPQQEKALVTDRAKSMERQLNVRSRPTGPPQHVVNTTRDRLSDISPVEKFRAPSKGLICSPLEGQSGTGSQCRSAPLTVSSIDHVSGQGVGGPVSQSFSQPFVQGDQSASHDHHGTAVPSSPGFPHSHQSQGVRPSSTTLGRIDATTWADQSLDHQWRSQGSIHPDQLDRRSKGGTGYDGSGNQQGSQAASYVTADQFQAMSAKLESVVTAVSKISQFQVRVL